MTTATLAAPRAMLFDWHGTLVNTYEPMYRAIEAMLLQLDELDLSRHIIPETQAGNAQDEKLLRYLRIFRRLHPDILAERRISRTDIFDVLFGDNRHAKAIAHAAYNAAYADQLLQITPFQDGICAYLEHLQRRGIRLGVVTNRSRRFLDAELAAVDGGRWSGLFEVTLCGDEAPNYKPSPDALWAAAARLGLPADHGIWFVGDSASDMVTARAAGVSAIFYNGALWDRDWLEQLLPAHAAQPGVAIEDFEQLLDLVDAASPAACRGQPRPPRLPPRQPPPARQAPDWHPALARLRPPEVILFDWHATLVDTLEAMYHAVDDMLRELRDMGLLEHLVPESQSKSPEDMRLVSYVRENLRLHPRITLDRKISRTDIFEVLFGDNEAAKQKAHAGFTRHYRNHFGSVLPFEPKVRDVLQGLQGLGLRLGVITNRDREFLLHELDAVDTTGWREYFEVCVCGDDTRRRKPHPDQIQRALRQLGCQPGQQVWYVGDSTTDVIAAKAAGITSVFFNGALWDQGWLNRIFPGNARFPAKPDVVVDDFSQFWALVLACRSCARSRTRAVSAQRPRGDEG